MALVAVTDHAVERYGERVRGTLDPRTEIAARVGGALAAGRREPGERGAVLVRDVQRPSLVYVCMEDKPRGELIVVTLYEDGRGGRRAAPVHRCAPAADMNASAATPSRRACRRTRRSARRSPRIASHSCGSPGGGCRPANCSAVA